MLLQWPISDFRTMDYSGMFPCALIKTELPPAGTVPCLAQLVFDNLIRLKTPENSPFVAEHFPEVTH